MLRTYQPKNASALRSMVFAREWLQEMDVRFWPVDVPREEPV